MMKYFFDTSLERSKLMKKIRSEDTQPEILLRKELWRQKIYYRKNYKLLIGRPDIVITKHRIVIFIDSEFFHGKNWGEKKEKIKSNCDYWIPKISRNIERDKEVNEYLISQGWTVLRFWSNDVKKNLSECVSKVKSVIENKI